MLKMLLDPIGECMATFVLIHGAAANAHYWYLVQPLLVEAGHTVITPDLPTSDSTAGFNDYAAAVMAAMADQPPAEQPGLIMVGQSLGAFTAPIVAQTVHTDLIVLVAPMIPAPGETPGEWGSNTAQPQAMEKYAKEIGVDPTFDVMTTFMHDVPLDIVDELMKAGEPPQSDTIFAKPFPLQQWPDIPTKVIVGTLDRMFPINFQRRLCQDRLGVVPDEISTGHLPAFANPEALAERLLAYADTLSSTRPL
jgi:pimeloyl-ACP methyl ester carboxylesterase